MAVAPSALDRMRPPVILSRSCSPMPGQAGVQSTQQGMSMQAVAAGFVTSASAQRTVNLARCHQALAASLGASASGGYSTPAGLPGTPTSVVHQRVGAPALLRTRTSPAPSPAVSPAPQLARGLLRSPATSPRPPCHRTIPGSAGSAVMSPLPSPAGGQRARFLALPGAQTAAAAAQPSLARACSGGHLATAAAAQPAVGRVCSHDGYLAPPGPRHAAAQVAGAAPAPEATASGRTPLLARETRDALARQLLAGQRSPLAVSPAPGVRHVQAVGTAAPELLRSCSAAAAILPVPAANPADGQKRSPRVLPINRGGFASADAADIQIEVLNAAGESVAKLSCHPSVSVLSLKRLLTSQYKHANGVVTSLLVGEKVLKDAASLAESGLVDGSQVLTVGGTRRFVSVDQCRGLYLFADESFEVYCANERKVNRKDDVEYQHAMLWGVYRERDGLLDLYINEREEKVFDESRVPYLRLSTGRVCHPRHIRFRLHATAEGESSVVEPATHTALEEVGKHGGLFSIADSTSCKFDAWHTLGHPYDPM
eukprot:TRINITY_DN25664_c0_g1_i1.p1 TRINITY_DN25664_c0_g1~~TRINITY_DN25664_c0_g1_i1.p1  ORF type:complete len:559 (-),score=112.69 TRINITY_DN25664_c0_g1_i1:193-1815(-)